MSMWRFSSSLLVKEFPKSFFYALTLIFQIAITIIFFAIPNNQLLLDEPVVPGEVPFIVSLSFVIIVFCCCLIAFATNFYVSKKSKEVAILKMSGWTPFRIVEFILIQIAIILAVAIPIGMILGYGIAVSGNFFLYQQAGIQADPFYIPFIAFSQSLFVIGLMLVIVLMVAYGYVYRCEISEFLNHSIAMQPKTSSTLIRPLFFIFLYLFGLFLIDLNNYGEPYFFQIFIGMIGAGGLVASGISYTILILKQRGLGTKRYALIYLSHLNYTLQKNVLLATSTIVSVTTLVTLMMTEEESSQLFTLVVISYVIAIFLLMTSIVYNYCIEIQQRISLFSSLWKMGYTVKELRLIIRKEVIFFYCIILLLPLVYLLAIGQRYVGNGTMTLIGFGLIISTYLIPIITSACIVYRFYVVTVVRSIERG